MNRSAKNGPGSQAVAAEDNIAEADAADAAAEAVAAAKAVGEAVDTETHFLLLLGTDPAAGSAGLVRAARPTCCAATASSATSAVPDPDPHRIHPSSDACGAANSC